MSENIDSVTQKAKDYYNSEDAENFYSQVWGGEDIHIGIYESETDTIFEASRRTVANMAKRLPTTSGLKILDLGSGYCGAARYLAKHLDCHVTALNLSEVENERARAMNNKEDLQDRITVVDGRFEDIPYSDKHFDVIWSQDALLHSPSRITVLKEAARVLKINGMFIFTDIMQNNNCPQGVLKPILDRIHLENLASPNSYENDRKEAGFSNSSFADLSPHLVTHYSKILEETKTKHDELLKNTDPDYLKNMKAGLTHWIEGGKNNHLVWGITELTKS